jgi:hypothetical protein
MNRSQATVRVSGMSDQRSARFMRRWGAASLALVLVSSNACEQQITVRGSVTVPLEVQQRFSPESKGRLVVLASYAGSGGPIGGSTVYVFCAPTSGTVTVPFNLTHFGCLSEVEVEALAFSIAGHPLEKVLPPLPCGTVDASPAGVGTQQDAVAYGRALVWQGRSGGGCKSGETTADFAVALKQ